MATPITVAVLGFILTQQSARQARDRDDAIRRANDARDAALRADAIAREEAAARQAERVARLTSLIQKRSELWDTIGPLVTALWVSFRADPPDLKIGRPQLEELRKAWVPHLFYFPDAFNNAMLAYTQELIAIREGQVRPDNARLAGLMNDVRDGMQAATEVQESLVPKRAGPRTRKKLEQEMLG